MALHFRAGNGVWSARGHIVRSGRGVSPPGTYLPGSETTGVDTTIPLVDITTPVVIGSPGEIYNQRFLNRVEIRAPGVRFVNCLFEGPAAPLLSAGGIVDAKHPNVRDLVLEDCTIRPRAPGHVTNCFEGHHFTWKRVNASGGVDACSIIAPEGVERADAVIIASWLHDLSFYSPTNTQTDNITHNDLIQWHGMKGLTIIGSRLDAFIDPTVGSASAAPVGVWPGSHVSGNPWYPNRYATSAIMCAPARAAMGELRIEKSWINGGRVAINAGAAGLAAMPDIGSIVDSWFGYEYGLGSDYAILTNSSQALTLTGNHRWNEDDPFDVSISFNVRKP